VYNFCHLNRPLKKRKMKKSAIVLLCAFLSLSAFAQNVQEGINHLNAQRYQSAKSVFDKLVAANPNNIEANYWLGQTYIKSKDSAAAVALYQKLISTNSNAPLALVGMGQVELMQGKTAEARQRFETAISLSKGRKGNDPVILTAIGRANTDAKAGDIAYAIQKLNEATQIAPTNADAFLALGNAYRKIPGSGSQAATAYLKSIGVAPSAMAYYRLSKLYSTQQNWDVVIENQEKAISLDPKFAPVYSDLYDYHFIVTRDFTKAEDFANKYIANADPSLDNERMKADIFYVQKKYDEAINAGKNIIQKGGDKTPPRVYKLVAYSLVEKGDTLAARPYVDQYFAKQDPEEIIGFDHVLYADVYASSNPNAVFESYKKAVQTDSVLANQLKFLNAGIDRFKKANQKIYEADLKLLSYNLRKAAGASVSPNELISGVVIPYYQSKAYQKSDSISKMYIGLAPDSIYGYIWSARSLGMMDTTMENGLAVDAYNKLLDAASKDKVRYKSNGIEASGYLAGYYNNIKKDKANAIVYLKRGLEFDPTNAQFQKSIEILSRTQGGTTPTRTQSQTSTSSNSAKDGETKVKTDKDGTVKKVKTN
jgi:tetratricopeptide (TPR) repeat protein